MNDECNKGLLENFQGFRVVSSIDLGEKLRQEQVFQGRWGSFSFGDSEFVCCVLTIRAEVLNGQ